MITGDPNASKMASAPHDFGETDLSDGATVAAVQAAIRALRKEAFFVWFNGRDALLRQQSGDV
jgi:hypothetical protein